MSTITRKDTVVFQCDATTGCKTTKTLDRNLDAPNTELPVGWLEIQMKNPVILHRCPDHYDDLPTDIMWVYRMGDDGVREKYITEH